MTRKQYPLKPSLRLWGAIRVWAILFMLACAVSIAGFGYRIWLLSQLPSDAYMTQESFLTDYLPGAEAEIWTTLLASVLYFLTYVVAGVMVLIWFLRSIRNARMLSQGVETSPAWVIWWFLIPLVSLWKPYSMASELWRSSQQPDGWKGLTDPVVLRWWWGFVLLGGFIISASSLLSRTSETVGQILIGDAVMMAGYAVQIIAGVFFLRIGSPISTRQTTLIGEGRIAPPSSRPGWST